MRVALFARYSSKLQDELSLDAQIQEMTTFVARQAGWEITHRFLLPETRSADIERSDEFQAMIKAAKQKQFGVLLVHKLDRFGRDRETSVLNKAMLRRLGIQVRSVCENLGDSIMDRAFEGMLEVMAEWYSGNLGQETRKGHRQLTRRGLWTGGTVPFGYRVEVVMEGSNERSKLVPCPKDGPIMAEVFALFATGAKTVAIQDQIRILTGEKWPQPSLYKRIRNPLYHGQLRYGVTSMPQGRPRRVGDEVTEGEVVGLVDKELWDRANEALTKRGRQKGPRSMAIASYLLSGLCKCSQCGAAVVGGREGGGRPKYSCSNRRGGLCSYSSVSAPLLEETVLNHMATYLRKMEAKKLAAAYKDSLALMRKDAENREKLLRKRLREVRGKIENLLNALEQGIIFADMQKRIQTLKADEGELAEALATCHIEAEHVIEMNSGLVGEWLVDVLARLDGKDPEDIRQLLQHVVELKLDLKEKRGELAIQLPLSVPGQNFSWTEDGLKNLRSARMTSSPFSRTAGKLLVPFRWAA